MTDFEDDEYLTEEDRLAAEEWQEMYEETLAEGYSGEEAREITNSRINAAIFRRVARNIRESGL